MKNKNFLWLLILISITSLNCDENPIWKRFTENPNVKLMARGRHAFVDFSNERKSINTGPDAGLHSSSYTNETTYTIEGVTITRVFKNIWIYSNNDIKSYEENRTYNPGGHYEIRVYDIIYDSHGMVSNFKAIVDGVEYSYP